MIRCRAIWLRTFEDKIQVLAEFPDGDGAWRWRIVISVPDAPLADRTISHIVEALGMMRAPLDPITGPIDAVDA